MKSVVSRTADRPSLWYYLSGLVVAFCGLIAARIVIQDQRFIAMMMVLTLVGFAFSFTARLLGWFELTTGLFVRWLFAGFIVYALFNFWTQGWVLPFDVESTYGGTAIAFLLWLVVFTSFMLASDEHVLFIAVPVVALLGVTAPALTSSQSFWLSVVFLGAVAFLLAYENYHRIYQTVKPDARFLRMHLSVALVCGALAALTGALVGLPLRDTRLQLSTTPMPYGLSSPNDGMASGGSFSRSTIPVGTGPVSLSDQVVLVVQAGEPLYWRGSVYVRYTGHGWANPRFGLYARDLFDANMPFAEMPERRNGLYTMRVPPISPRPDRYREVKQRYRLVSGASNIIYAAAEPVEVRFPRLSVRVDFTGSLLTYYGYRVGTEYEVVSHVPEATPEELRKAPAPTPAQVSMLYFEILQEPSQRLVELVRRLTARYNNNYDKVMALKNYIETTCQYNLNAPAVPIGRDAVEFFLFDAREGYCDLFSSALAVLARYAGIPSRVATGFISGERQPDGTFIVREKHRHQWTEIYFPGYGWIAFDPTEGARDVTSGNDNKGRGGGWQMLTRRFGHLPTLLLVGAVALLVFAVVNELRGRRSQGHAVSRVVRSYLRAVHMLQKSGIARHSWMTPAEYAALVQRSLPRLAEPMWELTRLLERSEYGRGVGDEEIAQADRCVREIRAELRRRYRWWRR